LKARFVPNLLTTPYAIVLKKADTFALDKEGQRSSKTI
jgi:hypothetical protein